MILYLNILKIYLQSKYKNAIINMGGKRCMTL